MSFHITSAAASELAEALDYYREIDHSIGVRFLREFESVVERICRYPDSGHPREIYRVAFIRGFPYGIAYTVQFDGVIVEAVPYLRRGPQYWKEIQKRTR